MRRFGWSVGRLGAVAALAFATTGAASGQTTPSSSLNGLHKNANVNPSPATTQPLALSIYANPYTNPWINPLAMQNQVSRNDLGWYLFAGQQASLGLGTGRISGTRTDPRNLTSKPPREITMPLATRVPGGNAAGFFLRGGTATQSGRYYQRQNSHFLSNGH